MGERYTRIRLTDDLDRVSRLIKTYLLDPSLADSVEEVYIDTSELPGIDMASFHTSSSPTPPILRLVPKNEDDDRARVALEQLVESLGYEQESRDMMLHQLLGNSTAYADDGETERDDEEPSAKRQMRDDQYYHLNLIAAVILLAQCKNIEKLYVGHIVNHQRHSILRDFLLKANYGLLPTPCLQKLQHVQVVVPEDMYGGETSYATIELLDYFQLFHRLSALESISMDAVQEYQPDRSLFNPRTSNLRSLSITHADLDISKLITVLSIPKALQSFEFSVGGLNNTDGGQPLLIAGEIAKALSKHKRTLQSIVFDIDVAINFEYPHPYEDNDDQDESSVKYQKSIFGAKYLQLDQGISAESGSAEPESQSDGGKCDGPIGPFHDFEQLKTLKIGTRALFGDESHPREQKGSPSRLVAILPPRLEHFCLYDYVRGDDERVDEEIDELLEKQAELFPHLDTLEGISETCEGIKTIYGYEVDEDAAYERPEMDLGWKKVDS